MASPQNGHQSVTMLQIISSDALCNVRSVEFVTGDWFQFSPSQLANGNNTHSYFSFPR